MAGIYYDPVIDAYVNSPYYEYGSEHSVYEIMVSIQHPHSECCAFPTMVHLSPLEFTVEM